MTNQEDLDLVVPDPLSLTKYRWVYPLFMVGAVTRYVCHDGPTVVLLESYSNVAAVRACTVESPARIADSACPT